MLLSWLNSGGQAGAGLTCADDWQSLPIWNKGLKSGSTALQTADLTSLGLLYRGSIWSMLYSALQCCPYFGKIWIVGVCSQGSLWCSYQSEGLKGPSRDLGGLIHCSCLQRRMQELAVPGMGGRLAGSASDRLALVDLGSCRREPVPPKQGTCEILWVVMCGFQVRYPVPAVCFAIQASRLQDHPRSWARTLASKYSSANRVF